MRHARFAVGLAALLVVGGGVALAQAPSASPTNIRGTIAKVEGDKVAIDARGGDKLTLTIPADMPITAVVPAKMEDIKPGGMIGTAATPQPDGSYRAMEVQIFPASLRGVPQGQFPYDLTPQSAMINANVADVVGTSGRTVTLKYKGKETKLVVPPDAPIITFAPGDRAMLKPGAHVFIVAAKQPDGALAVRRVQVGKDGLVPPM